MSRRRTIDAHSAADLALDRIARGAEDRLSRRRQARSEARMIRMRELERQQREADTDSDKKFGTAKYQLSHVSSLLPASSYSHISRTGSRASIHDPVIAADETSTTTTSSIRKEETINLQDKVSELEEKFRRAMFMYSQLDNEKSALMYDIDLLRDNYEEQLELTTVANREIKELTSKNKLLERNIAELGQEKEYLRLQLEQRDQLIQENGIVLIERNDDEDSGDVAHGGENGLSNGHHHNQSSSSSVVPSKPFVFTMEAARLIDRIVPDEELSLDQKLKKVAEINKSLKTQLNDAEQALLSRKPKPERSSLNDDGLHELQQKDAAKTIADLKFKLQEIERENTYNQGNAHRFESTLKRYKTQVEEYEKEINDFKLENRSLKKEVRDKDSRLDEAQETNKHLQQRLEKMKSSTARRALH